MGGCRLTRAHLRSLRLTHNTMPGRAAGATTTRHQSNITLRLTGFGADAPKLVPNATLPRRSVEAARTHPDNATTQGHAHAFLALSPAPVLSLATPFWGMLTPRPTNVYNMLGRAGTFEQGSSDFGALVQWPMLWRVKARINAEGVAAASAAFAQ